MRYNRFSELLPVGIVLKFVLNEHFQAFHSRQLLDSFLNYRHDNVEFSSLEMEKRKKRKKRASDGIIFYRFAN